jgi:hypothetical protein
MMRMAPKGKFKSNIAQGGVAKEVTLKPRLMQMVLRTAAICGLDIAGESRRRRGHEPLCYAPGTDTLLPCRRRCAV